MLVVIPFCAKDEALCLKNMEVISMFDGKLPHTALLAHDRLTDPVSVEKAASKIFASVRRFAYEPWAGEQKWPTVQNWAWQETARFVYANHRDEPWFWWEADAVPLCKGWMQQLEDEYKKAGQPFMGHIVEKMGHMNGVAVYPGNVMEFSVNAMLVRSMPWDVMLKDETIFATHRANHLMSHYPRYNGIEFSFSDKKPLKELQQRGIVIFHGCNDGTLQDLILGRTPKPSKSSRKFSVADIDGEFDESEPIWQQESKRIAELGYGCLEYQECKKAMAPIRDQTKWETGTFELGLSPVVCHFNSGLTRDEQGKLWLVVRRWNRRGEKGWHSTLVACHLDEKLQVISQYDLVIPGYGYEQHEDPRVTFHNGKFHVAHCFWKLGEPYQARQWFSTFNRSWEYESTSKISYGANKHGGIGGAEKNWLWFWHDRAWQFVYGFAPHVVIRAENAFQLTEYRVPTDVSKWEYGEIRGGTPPVRVGDEYISFFHSSLAWRGRQKRYVMGAYAFEAKSPFRVTRMTLKPLLCGSERDSRIHGGPLTVFACGSVFDGKTWIVTGGLNDEKCFWIKIPHEDLEKEMVKI